MDLLIINQLKDEIKQLKISLADSKSANKRIKKEARFNDYNKLQRRFYSKCQEVECLRKALEFYADDKNNYHKLAFTVGEWEMASNVVRDDGEIARQALNNR